MTHLVKLFFDNLFVSLNNHTFSVYFCSNKENIYFSHGSTNVIIELLINSIIGASCHSFVGAIPRVSTATFSLLQTLFYDISHGRCDFK